MKHDTDYADGLIAALQRTVFAPGQSVAVFEVDGTPEVFIGTRRLLREDFFHVAGASSPQVEAAARSLRQPTSPTLVERAHAVLTLLLFVYQLGVIALLFAAGARHPLWQPSQVLLAALLGGFFLAIGLHFLLAAIVSRSMREPFAVSMSRGLTARAHRAHGQVGETAVYPGYLLGSRGPMARTYVSAGHGRGLVFTQVTGSAPTVRFRHIWVETRDIDGFLRALREAVTLSLRGRSAPPMGPPRAR